MVPVRKINIVDSNGVSQGKVSILLTDNEVSSVRQVPDLQRAVQKLGTIDSIPEQGSSNAISSDAVYSALQIVGEKSGFPSIDLWGKPRRNMVYGLEKFHASQSSIVAAGIGPHASYPYGDAFSFQVPTYGLGDDVGSVIAYSHDDGATWNASDMRSIQGKIDYAVLEGFASSGGVIAALIKKTDVESYYSRIRVIGDNRFVEESGADYIICISNDGGVTWTEHSRPADFFFYYEFDADKEYKQPYNFDFFGTVGGKMIAITSASQRYISGAQNPSAPNAHNVYQSADGVNWIKIGQVGDDNSFSYILAFGSILIAQKRVPHGYNAMYVSRDGGANWDECSWDEEYKIEKVVYNESVGIFSGFAYHYHTDGGITLPDGQAVCFSSDGVNWSYKGKAYSQQKKFYDIDVIGDLYFCSRGQKTFISIDGQNWYDNNPTRDGSLESGSVFKTSTGKYIRFSSYTLSSHSGSQYFIQDVPPTVTPVVYYVASLIDAQTEK